MCDQFLQILEFENLNSMIAVKIEAIERGHTMSLFQSNLQLMQMCTVPGKNYSMPESVEDSDERVDRQRPVFTMLYFSGGWNPMCAKIISNYQNLHGNRPPHQHRY